jgi:F-type H+-transporting ATPase subunit delta
VTDRIDAYASALLEVAKAEGNLETVEDELFRFARTLDGNDDLRMTLSDATLPLPRRQAIIDELLENRVSPVTLALISFVVSAGRTRNLSEIIDRLVERAAEERREAVAEVRTAYALDPERRQKLVDALERATGKHISIKEIVDPSILGGVVATVGDTVIDGSIRHRLEKLRETL